jgi:hypothetical protein
MNNSLKKTLLMRSLAGVFALATTGAIAQSFPDFTVSEAPVPGATASTVNADKITGNYTEVVTFNGSASSGTFDVSLRWNAGQFVANNGSTPGASQLGGITANQYGLYALYSGSGTYTTTGSLTTFIYNRTGNLSVFLDPASNTTFIQPGTGAAPFITGNNSDDIALANGITTTGQGQLDPSLPTCPGAGGSGSGINCGNFGVNTTFNLSAAGTQYFSAPVPFYAVSFQSAQLNNGVTPNGTQVINGSLDVTFVGGGSVPPGPGPSPVPEPASIALLALGLIGLGLSRRRNS